MQYRIDKRTGNQISALGYGCMRFPRSMEATEALIKKSIEEGINYFDTAYLYGTSEEKLGQILEKNGWREDIYIATKLPLFFCHTVADFDKYFSRQLSRLRTEYIDYYLMHMITDMAQWKKLCVWGIEAWIAQKKEEGKIKQIGFSFHGSQGDFLEILSSYDWDFCQIQYNYSDENYQAGVTGLKAAAEKDIPVIIMEPLLGGKLVTGLPTKALSIFQETNKEFTPAGWGLRWLWDQPEVTCVLSGMNDMAQLEDNIHVANITMQNTLTQEEKDTYQAVKKVFFESYKIPCTGCAYCMPCPQNVNIPACFSAYNASYTVSRVEGLKQYYMSVGGISETRSLSSLCVQCGKCEKHCPQNIHIIEGLKSVRKKMEPAISKPMLSIARRFLHRNKGE